MIKLLRYKKRIKALKYFRDNNVKRKDIKILFGDEGISVFEEAVIIGAIYPSTMGISGRKNEKLDTLIENYKGLFHDGLCTILRIVIGVVFAAAVTYSIRIVINYNSKSNNFNIINRNNN